MYIVLCEMFLDTFDNHFFPLFRSVKLLLACYDSQLAAALFSNYNGKY